MGKWPTEVVRRGSKELCDCMFDESGTVNLDKIASRMINMGFDRQYVNGDLPEWKADTAHTKRLIEYFDFAATPNMKVFEFYNMVHQMLTVDRLKRSKRTQYFLKMDFNTFTRENDNDLDRRVFS